MKRTRSPEDKAGVMSPVSNHKREIPLLFSDKAAISRSNKTPAEGVSERFERSYETIGPAVEQTLTFSSSKEGEERRTCVAVISIQRKSEKQLSPKASATFRLPSHQLTRQKSDFV